MKVGVIMPHRNDRPLFLEQFHRMLSRQTLQPDILEIVDYPPKSDLVDITERYKFGYEELKGKGLDCILTLEVDDWYAPNYLEVIVREWQAHGCPEMFGTNYTTYYHLRLGKAFTFYHEFRSSMMSTLMKADLEIKWPHDNYAYTDMYLWMHCKNRKTFAPKEGYIALGLKHGHGLTGGQYHNDKLKMFKENINFSKIVGEEDFKFYSENFPICKTKLVGREVVFID